MTQTRHTFAVLAIATLGLSGCAQIGSIADGVWGGTKSAARFVTSPVRGLLRGPS